MLINLFLYLLRLCRIIDDIDEVENIQQQEYKDVCNNMPNKYLHHLEDPEDYYYHPLEF
tara:strand:+ start:80 stop:256 length:177 start_codon:yes stop_codon:yes gene_type:complete